jgi:D-arabinono-1,4-lactone oxidase/FAD binding domain
MPSPIINFGGNIRFTPQRHYAPATEQEILEILDRHAQGKIRAVGALHSWNAGVVSDDVTVDLRHIDGVEVQRDAKGAVWATVGGGCRIKHLLRKLHRLADATVPSLGLITEQTIAGAISTATHGSGRCSLSHYVEEVRAAAYDAATGKACLYTWTSGSELRAARCALGCMGIILSVKIRCVPRYDLAETMVRCAPLSDVLVREGEFPLQQFYLVPYLWEYFVQRRLVMPQFHGQRQWSAKLFRAWWFCGIDVGLHTILKTLLALPKSPIFIRYFFQHVLAKLILTNTTVVDHAERMLVMKHELFKHLEIEIFVPGKLLRTVTAFVRDVLEIFDGTGPAWQNGLRETASALESVGMYDELLRLRGTFTHHYPITFRRVLPDDALISMTGGAAEPWFAISFITYAEPRDGFFALASFLARSMTRLFDARLHWGKYFPLDRTDIESSYPNLPEFCASCRQVDPRGVFRNAFVERVLFGDG